jgi:ABC-2 type transport system permease protein
MKIWHVFCKTLKEQFRDWMVLSLSVVLAPMFVFLYWSFFPEGSTTYSVLVINEDTGSTGAAVIADLTATTNSMGAPLLTVSEPADRAAAEKQIRDRDAHVLLLIPPDFTAALDAYAQNPGREPQTGITFSGDLSNPYYAVAAILTSATVMTTVETYTGVGGPVAYYEEPLGASGVRTEFELYVPGLLIFAVVMLIFMASMTVAREIEQGTVRRLQLTRMTAVDLLGGITLTMTLLGAVSLVLAFLTATLLGFHSQGPLWVAVLVGVITSLAIIGVGLVVASLSRTVAQAFVVANFPMVLLMFFSGAIYPFPRLELFQVGAVSVGVMDILPTTHAVVALNKIMTLGAGLGDVAYELIALVALSLVYFAVGVWLFQRQHLRAA